jgi:hypothetical protein
MEPPEKLEALIMESMVLHGSCALHKKLLQYDNVYVYAGKIVLKKATFWTKTLVALSQAPPYSIYMESIKSDGTSRKNLDMIPANLD